MRRCGIFIVVMLTMAACSKRLPPPVVVRNLPHVEPHPETAVANPTAPVPIPLPPPPAIPESGPPPPPVIPSLAAIEDAERAYLASDYPRAINRYDEYLKLAPDGDRRDQALFHLALMHALPAHRDWTRASAYLKELQTQHPNSEYQLAAQVLSMLRTELSQTVSDREKWAERAKRAEAELERYKQIDTDRLRQRNP